MPSTLAAKIVLLIGLAAGTSFVLLAIARDQTLLDSSYYAAMIDKQALLEGTRSPKIVFVGGSNLAFGLDSAMVEQQLCRPVVNMGLHIGLGMRLPLNDVRAFIHPGDTVVLSPEYQMFWGEFDGAEVLDWVLYIDPALARYLDSPGEYWALLSTFPSFMQTRLGAYVQTRLSGIPPDSIYDRRLLNRYGDAIGHLGKPGIDISELPLSISTHRELDAGAVAYVNDFEAAARAMGTATVFIFPAVPVKQYLENQSDIERMHAYLAEHLHPRILATPQEAALPLDDFFDTIYHLNAEGRQARTRLMIERLRPIVSAAGAGIPAPCK